MKNTSTSTTITPIQGGEHPLWHTLSPEDVATFFGVDIQLGVADSEERKKIYGPNTIDEGTPDSFIKIVVRQCKSPLLYILMIAIAITLVIGEYVDAMIVGGVVLINIIFGTIQEGKAQDAFMSLKKILQVQSVVVRDGKQESISSHALVPGDKVLLRAGDRITADMRIIYTLGMQIDESSITGESLPVSKQYESMAEKDLTISEQKNMLFAGTYVVSGSCSACVVTTGNDTELGKLSSRVRVLDAEMPLQESIRHMARALSIGVAVAITLLFIVGVLLGTPLIAMIRVAVSLMVSVIPEGLPVIVTLVLAMGVRHMSTRNVLVKKLHAVEALGQAQIIAVDKTGTLTRNELVVSDLITEAGTFQITGVGYDQVGDIRDIHKEKITVIANTTTLDRLAYYAGLSANASVLARADGGTHIVGDPIEAALRIFAKKCGYDQEQVRSASPLLRDTPFDFKKKYYVALFDTEKVQTIIQTGAGEVLINMATHIETEKGVMPFTQKMKKEYLEHVHDMSKRGLRVIGLNYSQHQSQNVGSLSVEDMIFVGLLGMQDALRAEVPQALLDAKNAGMKVVMITGDHVGTAVALARQAGIYQDDDIVLSGEVVEEMSVAELARVIEKVSVFARMVPEHKVKIIQAYQQRGIVVAMTGDGVNDVPSLVVAQLGVAMGKGGTESAKDAADIVLLDDNFGHIPEAVAEGRHLYHAIKKVLVYLFSTNLSEFIIIVCGVLFMLPLPMTPAQIIWLNVITDTFLVVALALEPKEFLHLRKRRLNTKVLIDRYDMWRMGIMATTMALGSLIIFSRYLDQGYVVATSMVLLTLTFFQWFNLWNVRSEESVFLTIKNLFKNKLLVWSSIAVLVLQILVLYVPGMQRIFNTTGLSLVDWLIALAVGMSIVGIEELRKKFFTIVAGRAEKL